MPDPNEANPSPENAPAPQEPLPPPSRTDLPVAGASEDEWVEVVPARLPAAPEPPAEVQVTELPVREEPAEPIARVVVDETLPMARPALDEAEPKPEGKGPSGSYLVARYGLMQQLGEFIHDLPTTPLPHSKVVIRTERGVELGDVVVTVSTDPTWRCVTSSNLRDYIRGCGPEYPYTRGGKVLRVASPQDIIDFRHLATSAREEGTYARQQIREMNLAMRLVTVEHLLGGERIIFYFSSESRVDFRDLVHRLASQFRTRIEMRQVGARDEARLVGDYERCGQRVCCQEYLKDLKPVSMRMAKTQKATLDPSKISGRCGRLMCCLRYEDSVYEDLRKALPRRNIWVRTEKLVGKVVDVQIITQLVQLLLMDNTIAVVANEEILERDIPAPAIPTGPTREAPPPRDRGERRMLRDISSQPRPGEATPTPPPEAIVAGAVNETGPLPVPAPIAEGPGDGLVEVGEPAGGSLPAEGGRGPQASGQGERGQGERGRGRRRRGRRGHGGQGGDQNRGQGQAGQAPQPQGNQPPPPSNGGGRPPQAQRPPGGGGQAQGEGGGRRRRHRRGGRRGGGGGGGQPGGPGGGPSGGGSPPPA